jgi:hypothetical protein
MFMYIYNALLYTDYVYTLCLHKHKMLLCQEHKINTLITQCALLHRKKHLAYAHIFQYELFPTAAVQQKQYVESVVRCTFLGG